MYCKLFISHMILKLTLHRHSFWVSPFCSPVEAFHTAQHTSSHSKVFHLRPEVQNIGENFSSFNINIIKCYSASIGF